MIYPLPFAGTLIDPGQDQEEGGEGEARGAVAVSLKGGMSAVYLSPKVNLPAHEFSSRCLAIVHKHKLELSMVGLS